MTPGELKPALQLGGREIADKELADPSQWRDLLAQQDLAVAVIRRRIASGTTPESGAVFLWPKDRTAQRELAWLDPFDLTLYRALVGRVLPSIYRLVDPDVVLSHRLKSRPPRWALERHTITARERRAKGLALVLQHGAMAKIDIASYYPSVTTDALAAVFGSIPINRPSLLLLLRWLDRLASTSTIAGLPVGPIGSDVLGNALLSVGDQVLANVGVPFLRWVDDTWCFLDSDASFDALLAEYGSAVAGIGLAHHPDKSRVLDPLEAMAEIENSAVAYTEAITDSDAKLTTALDLLAVALEDPDTNKTELRGALNVLRRLRSPEALAPVIDDPTLIALAPIQWRRYLGVLAEDRRLCRQTHIDDWLVAQILKPYTPADAYITLVLLHAAAGAAGWAKSDANQLVAQLVGAPSWAVPIQVAGAHLWSKANGHRGHKAVECLEAVTDLSAKRAFALTLERHRHEPKAPTWIQAVRKSDEDLAPTAVWLEAA